MIGRKVAKPVLAILALLLIAGIPPHVRAGQSILLMEKPVVSLPQELPADVTVAVLAVVELLRGIKPAEDSGVELRESGFEVNSDDMVLYRQFRVEGYSLSAILPYPGLFEGRQLAGTIYFKDNFELRMTVNFAAEYYFQDEKIVLEKVGARLVTPENPRVKTFFVRSGDSPGSDGPVKTMRDVLKIYAPVAVDIGKVKAVQGGFESFLVISVFFDRMPKGETAGLRISYSADGPAYKPTWLINKDFNGWWIAATSEWLNLTDGPAKYYKLTHSKSVTVNGEVFEKRRLLHAFTPVAGGRRLVTPDLAELFPNKVPVNLVEPALGAGKATLEFSIGMKGKRTKVHALSRGSPAYRGGLREGDEILAVNGVTIMAPEDLQEAEIRPGRETEIIYLKSGEQKYRSAIVIPTPE